MFDSIRWQGFEFRPDDIVISTPPKCGTTWTQMICALLVFQKTTFDRPMDQISPWLDKQTNSLESITKIFRAADHPTIHQDSHTARWSALRSPRDIPVRRERSS